MASNTDIPIGTLEIKFEIPIKFDLEWEWDIYSKHKSPEKQNMQEFCKHLDKKAEQQARAKMFNMPDIERKRTMSPEKE